MLSFVKAFLMHGKFYMTMAAPDGRSVRDNGQHTARNTPHATRRVALCTAAAAPIGGGDEQLHMANARPPRDNPGGRSATRRQHYALGGAWRLVFDGCDGPKAGLAGGHAMRWGVAYGHTGGRSLWASNSRCTRRMHVRCMLRGAC